MIARTRTPQPYDLYNAWQLAWDPDRPLTPFQEALVLSVCPPGSRIAEARFHRTKWLPCPVLVQVALASGGEISLNLRQDLHVGGVETEARLLPVLARWGLPVPELLAGPVTDPDRPELSPVTVLTVLPGKDLGTLSWTGSVPPRRIAWAGGLVLEAVARLHALTEPLDREEVARHLRRTSLSTIFESILERGGPWLEEPVFTEAAKRLKPILAELNAPLVFSNGDYNPGNFLSDGERLTGFVDFGLSCFEDPHYGFAKYWTYDWSPFNHAGLVERYLVSQGLTLPDFAPRLAVRCLWTLQREIAVEGEPSAYRSAVLGFLRQAMAWMG
jgi:aminoglycoside phosphotransferase (APT) family kinase protein